LERNIDYLEFAPKHTFEELEKHLIIEIQKAKHSIFAAVAWFTNSNIMNALKERANEGIDVILLVDKGQPPGNTRTYEFIKKCGVLPFYVYPCLSLGTYMGSTYQNTMHHKFCIIDNKVVVYGTYNWTTKAEYNDEDLTIDDNKKSVDDFTNRFCELRKKYSKIYGSEYSSEFWK
jgi:phosphatidylserine/phosphatidylglycerophosphate/cardiolipin synthase-like enzyme